MADVWYLALGYGIIWLGLFGYLFRLSRQARDLSQELDALRDVLATQGRDESRWDESSDFDERPRVVVGELLAANRPPSGEA